MSDNPYESPEVIGNVATVKRPWKTRIFTYLSIAAILLVLVSLLMPATRDARGAARRTRCKNNLKQIVLALHNYHDAYGAFPPAYTVDSNGRPLHSWRTLILPHIERRVDETAIEHVSQTAICNSVDLSKPWNDPANAEAFKTVPEVYSCPSADLPAGFTSYLAVVGSDCCFSPTTSKRFEEITDGASETLMVVEVAAENSVPWMAPQDADQQIVLSFTKGGKLAHTGGTQVALADGGVRFVSQDVDLITLRALMTIAGGEDVGEF
jgi:hypothetical protein